MRRSRNVVVCFVSAVLLALVSHGAAAGETILYSFKGGRDGANPNSRLVTDSEGNLYGTTGTGGIRDMGTVFKLTNRRRPQSTSLKAAAMAARREATCSMPAKPNPVPPSSAQPRWEAIKIWVRCSR